MNKKLSIAYRIYPGVSKVLAKKPIIHSDDKFKLVKECCRSFKQSLGGLNVKIWFILDSCPESYSEWISQNFQNINHELIKLNNGGNERTFEEQINILSNQNFSDIIYFAEDDYLYAKNSIEIAYNFLVNNTADVISLYDNPDYYLKKMHDYPKQFLLEDNLIWKSVSNTTLTFMTSKDILINIKDSLETFTKKNNDSSIWMGLTKIGLLDIRYFYRFFSGKDRDLIKLIKAYYFSFWSIISKKKILLFVPMPSLATHLEASGIAPLFKLDQAIDS